MSVPCLYINKDNKNYELSIFVRIWGRQVEKQEVCFQDVCFLRFLCLKQKAVH